MKQFLRFATVGVLLFVLDAGFFSAMLRIGCPVVVSRVTAVCVAIFASWLVNRNWTFRGAQAPKDASVREFLKFAATQALGAGVNTLVSLFAYGFAVVAAFGPWAAVAAGSAAGLMVNFIGAKYLVFNRVERPLP